MLDVQWLRSRLDEVKAALARRGAKIDWSRFEALESERKDLQTRTQELQAQRNALSKEVGRRKGRGEDASDLLAQLALITAELDACEERLSALLTELESFFATLPNIPHPSVPDGTSEADNVEVARWGIGAVLAASCISKGVLALASGGWRYGAWVAGGLLVMVACGSLGLLAG